MVVAHDTFQAGDLTAVIGDNEVYDQRRYGYNGIHRLIHRTNPKPLFDVAGLNLEHIYDGDKDQRNLAGDKKIFFEPRNHPMTLTKISDSEAELHQEGTPNYGLESWTRFKLVAPHCIDFTFRCMPHQLVFVNGYIGLFRASTIAAPEDKSLYFRDEKGWVQYCTQAHNDESTVLHKDDKTQLRFTEVPEQCLYKNFSPLKFSDPFYTGYFGTHQWILMFDRAEGIRFCHSPSSGGVPSFPNPAWDFQYIIPGYKVLQEYGFRARAVYRERCSRDEVLREFQTWRESLDRK